MNFFELYQNYKLILNLQYIDCIVNDEEALNEFYANFFKSNGEEYVVSFLNEHIESVNKEAYIFYTLKTICEHSEAFKFHDVADKCKKALLNSEYTHYEVDKNSKEPEIVLNRVTAQELVSGKNTVNDVKARRRIELLEKDIDLEKLFDGASISEMAECYGKNFILNRYITSLGLVDLLSTVETLSKKQKINLLKNVKKIRQEIDNHIDELREKNDIEILYKYIPIYLKKYPNEFDLDEILLFASAKAISNLEYRELTEDEKENYVKILQVAEKHIKSSSAIVKLIDVEGKSEAKYSYRDLQTSSKRITKSGEYFSVKEENRIRDKMSLDINAIREVKPDFVRIMKFSVDEYKELIENSDGILTYLVQNDLISENDYKIILNSVNINTKDFVEIIKLGKVNESQLKNYLGKQNYIDEELFKVLSEREMLTSKQKLDYYFEGKIDIKNLIQMSTGDKNEIAELLSVNSLIELYKDAERQEDYIKYANVFRTMALADKSKKEKDEISDNIIEDLGLDFENEDLIKLYKEHLISLRAVEAWGGSALITDMMRNAIVRPFDVKDICLDGNYDSIFEIMKDNKIPRKNKLAIFYTTFADEDDSLTAEQQELRELAKEECIKYMNFSEKNIRTASKGNRTLKNSKDDIKLNDKRNQYVSDPLNRWTLAKLLDNEYSYEMLDQGMMIFKFPNLDGGTIMLEKMFRKEMPDYGRATKILHMSIEEFEKIKDDLIMEGDIPVACIDSHFKLEGKVDSLWHSASWGQKLADLFDYQLDKRRSKENIEKIDREIVRIKNSRKLR